MLPHILNFINFMELIILSFSDETIQETSTENR